MPVRRMVASAFDSTIDLIACALVTALLGCVALGALTRTLGEPLTSTDELSRFLMVWLAVFGWIIASRRRIHVRIRYFQHLLPGRAQRVAEGTIQAAMTIFGTLIAVHGAGLIGKNQDLQATTLPISMAWMYAPIVLGGAVTALQGASELIGALRRPRSPASNEMAALE